MARLFPLRSSLFAFFALGRSSAFQPAHPRLFFSSSSALAMSKRVLVPIGEGSEEIETTCITDILVRFGAKVTIASVMNGELLCKMSRGIKVRTNTSKLSAGIRLEMEHFSEHSNSHPWNIQVMADTTIEEAAKHEWDLVVLPGGLPGTLSRVLYRQNGRSTKIQQSIFSYGPFFWGLHVRESERCKSLA